MIIEFLPEARSELVDAAAYYEGRSFQDRALE